MKYIYVLFEFKQTIFYFSGRLFANNNNNNNDNNNNNNNNSNFITDNTQIPIWMYMINACYRNNLIYIKKVLTKDLKVVKFFSCLVWRGRAKLSSWCRIFSSRSRSHNFRLLSIWTEFLNCLLFHCLLFIVLFAKKIIQIK